MLEKNYLPAFYFVILRLLDKEPALFSYNYKKELVADKGSTSTLFLRISLTISRLIIEMLTYR